MSTSDDSGPADTDDTVGVTEAEQLLARAIDVIAKSRPMPLSASVMINRDEVLELLEAARDRFPDDLRRARWLLKEREEFLGRARSEADAIIEAARAQAERMVQRTEVVRAAKQSARHTIEEAQAESRRLRREAEDYIDQKLASFEIVLDRVTRTVQAGRARLQAPRDDAEDAEDEDAESPAQFFDQDQYPDTAPAPHEDPGAHEQP